MNPSLDLHLGSVESALFEAHSEHQGQPYEDADPSVPHLIAACRGLIHAVRALDAPDAGGSVASLGDLIPTLRDTLAAHALTGLLGLDAVAAKKGEALLAMGEMAETAYAYADRMLEVRAKSETAHSFPVGSDVCSRTPGVIGRIERIVGPITRTVRWDDGSSSDESIDAISLIAESSGLTDPASRASQSAGEVGLDEKGGQR